MTETSDARIPVLDFSNAAHEANANSHFLEDTIVSIRQISKGEEITTLYHGTEDMSARGLSETVFTYILYGFIYEDEQAKMEIKSFLGDFTQKDCSELLAVRAKNYESSHHKQLNFLIEIMCSVSFLETMD